ncbi:iron ABC transporter permease [Paenibacillus sp. IB182496]|uniref:Iron ABC transporter permease n=1 Tax=Paenibacillus sabuli TaxID=2772509 RepID=A0A927BTI5_9BACL|nr:iron ABC transporter permease [Paenibacillus sabuli]MBD2845495.1 iron ABC transporter permease [Paenibacillus sabuli]
MNRVYTYRSRRGAVNFQIERRTLRFIGGLSLLAALVCIAGTGLGHTSIPPWEVLATMLGIGSGEHDFVVLTLRLPRVLTALLVGAALGISGTILQGLIRNPLASPDIVGITGGASAAAVAFLTYAAGTVSLQWLPAAAIAGALLVSLLIYALSWQGGVTPIRLVLVGIGLSAAASAVTTMMIVRSPMVSAGEAYIWLTGSVYGASWQDVHTVWPVVAAGLPLALAFARSLNAQELGDEVAGGLGVAIQPHRAALLLISVVLAGFAVSVAGAVGFVGLLAPHLARRLVGRPLGGQLVVAGLLGGLIVFAADLIARTAFYPLDVPAGVFTAGVGAPFFLYLLFRGRNR